MEHNYHNDKSLQAAIDQLLKAIEGGANSKIEVNQVIEAYPEHEKELLEFLTTWEGLEEVSVPPMRPEMDTAFYKMLSNKQNTTISGKTSSWKTAFSSLIKRVLNPKLLAIIAATAIGILIGKYGFNDNIENGTKSIENNRSSTIQFANLQDQNTFDRLEKVNNVREMNEPDEKILEALNKTLLYDTNVNVRLSALETMMVFADHPKVREYLIKSIPFQDSPIVQMELAELMIALEERRSSDNWQQLLESGMVESDVKQQLKKKLETIL